MSHAEGLSQRLASPKQSGSNYDNAEAIQQNATVIAKAAGSRVWSAAADFIKSNAGDGPKSLRALCFTGGVALTVVSFLGIFNVFGLLSGIATYCLTVYQLLFGLTAMVIETKKDDSFGLLSRAKPFLEEWCKFLTVPGGKGLLYLCAGNIGLTLWSVSFLQAIVGFYLLGMGVACLMVHFGKAEQLKEQMHKAGVDLVIEERRLQMAEDQQNM